MTTRDERVETLNFQDTAEDPQNVGDIQYHTNELKAKDATSVFNIIEHRTRRELIHFIESGGPCDGFQGGSPLYREMDGSPPFFTGITWYVDNTKAKKIVDLVVNRSGGVLSVTEAWKMYDTDGSTVKVQVVDTITYTSNVFESSRSRAVTEY